MNATKRKLDDAFHTLDRAVETPSPPAKRAHTTPSLYATLAKYGVKPKQRNSNSLRAVNSLSKSTPHLSAILARAATRTRKAMPFSSAPPTPIPLPPTAEYRPSSIPSFLARLATFKLIDYSSKPVQIDAVAAAKCGWVNDGKDRLVCGLCGVSWVVAGREGMSREAANAQVEKQKIGLVEKHKNGCPWRTRQCDPTIYRIPLQAPAVMVREIKMGATVLHPLMQQMEVKHPLSASQLASLRATIAAFPLPPPDEGAAPPPEQLSDTAILTALFGWAPAPPSTDRPRLSVSRPSSRAASPMPGTPTRLSRASSLAPHRHSTPPPASTSTSVPGTPPRQFLRRISSGLSVSKRETSLLHCALCQRRVGLWAFAPPPPPGESKHRSFCPLVVRSTLVPSLPAIATGSTVTLSGTSGNLEGWRAVLTVVLRYGMGTETADAAEDWENINGVEAMVASVKSKGGKELLKYVKGLLG
ncbi:C3HC zinc finger-like-domain-containing protein [Roridomyces roridus]|uniref:C3HC zinc finger-like-domain-containing protein n=1 Tax=Roridomyces roridus TaxID=1738132 RepID=A0AAD7G2G7_9AGAR|nr:C3HC zinc finger-like-domain-containing protein [Roridomyces roridus]